MTQVASGCVCSVGVRFCQRFLRFVKEPNNALFASSFILKLEKPATETYELLQQAYGEDEMGHTQVFDWFRRFKDGRTYFESEPRSEKRKIMLLAFFYILRVLYTTSKLPTGKQLTRTGGLATFA
jgi:hypothetical protein